MGCATSTPAGAENKAQSPTLLDERRRVSAANVDASCKKSPEAVEADRGVIISLGKENVIQLVEGKAEVNGRKFSIGSAPDDGLTSFVNKTIASVGDDVQQVGLGYTCRKGLKPEMPNQDSWSVLRVADDFSIYAVYDGHGKAGHDVSEFVKAYLPKLIVRESDRLRTDGNKEAMVDCFKQMQSLVETADALKQLDAKMAGTTASVVVHDHVSNKILVSHVADSTVVLARFTEPGSKEMEAVQLTRDHKPDLKDERARIEKTGARVVFDGYANHRVYAKNGKYPGLNMSRCIGDLKGYWDAGLSAEPEVNERHIKPEDQVLLVCSDGVWEFIEPQEAVDIIAPFGPGKAQMAADRLAKEAWDRWIQEEDGAVVDDITVILVYLKSVQKNV